VLAAVRAGLTEEVIFIGYLFDRLRRLGWGAWTIILSTAALRGAYHAYQGFGAIVGNVAMGVVFGWVYHRWGRVMPLVVAHVLIDLVAFIGYPLAWWPALF
jgi:membrane protease YdiL (CAAX protease family)